MLFFPVNLHGLSFPSDAMCCLFCSQSQGQFIRARFPTCSQSHMTSLSHHSSTEQRTVSGDWWLELLTLMSTPLCRGCSFTWGLAGRASRSQAYEAPIHFPPPAKPNEHKLPLHSKSPCLNSPVLSKDIWRTSSPQYYKCKVNVTYVRLDTQGLALKPNNYHYSFIKIYVVREVLKFFTHLMFILWEAQQHCPASSF